MKQLTCEMCGSTDIVKQDGVFVCQSCGIKYSIEEAKRLMIEGTVEVQGTVKVDNSASVEKYLANARRARQKEDWEETEKYYNMVEQNDPTNIEAVFYSSYAKARSLMIESDHFKRAHGFTVLSKTLSIIDDNYQEGNIEQISKISDDLINLGASGFVYKGIDKDKLADTYKAFSELNCAWVESLANIANKISDFEEKKSVYKLCVLHYKEAMVNPCDSFADYKTYYVDANSWLCNNDEEYDREHKREEIEHKREEIQKKIKETENAIGSVTERHRGKLDIIRRYEEQKKKKICFYAGWATSGIALVPFWILIGSLEFISAIVVLFIGIVLGGILIGLGFDDFISKDIYLAAIEGRNNAVRELKNLEEQLDALKKQLPKSNG